MEISIGLIFFSVFLFMLAGTSEMQMFRFVLYIIAIIFLVAGLLVLFHFDVAVDFIILGLVQIILLGIKNVWNAILNGVYKSNPEV